MTFTEELQYLINCILNIKEMVPWHMSIKLSVQLFL